MVYYLDCPICKNDLSHFASKENLNADLRCPECNNRLKLHYGESWDDEFGCMCGYFWLERLQS